jgi:putative membrane protein
MKTLSKIQTAKIAIVLWYLVGIAGFMIRPLQPLFQKLTPFGMVMATALLMFFHEPKNKKSALIFSGIALFGFVIELIGVNTQAIFGFYIYGDSLGPKLWNTPVVIGINWLVLIYCISSLAKPIRNTWYFPLIGAATMVAFDWLMEPVAIATDMWYWASGFIPNKNYIDWFLVSGLLFLMIRILKVEISNRIAGILFAMQVVFFLALNILSRT